MRFILIVKATGYSETGIKYSPEHNEAMIAYKKSLAKSGVLCDAEEFQPSSTGIRLIYPAHGGKPKILAGPFLVDQGLITEYTLIDVRAEDEAADWALQMPVPRERGIFEIEIRQLKESPVFIQDPRTLAMETDLEEQINMLKKI